MRSEKRHFQPFKQLKLDFILIRKHFNNLFEKEKVTLKGYINNLSLKFKKSFLKGGGFLFFVKLINAFIKL